MYIKCLINCQDRCSTHGQRYHCDLQKKRNYFGFNQFGNVIFRILEMWHGSSRFIPDHQTGMNRHLKPGQWERGLTNLNRMKFLTLINWTSPFPFEWVLGGIFHCIQILIEHFASKQRWPWSEAALCGVWSGSALFAYVPQKDARLIWANRVRAR